MNAHRPVTRTISLSGKLSFKAPSNQVKNTKYTICNFIFKFLFSQFSQSMNFFFLIISLSQTYPPFQVGFLFTYIAPLLFVLVITMGKEIFDDFQRYKRDQEVNDQTCTQLFQSEQRNIKSSDIEVGYILKIHRHERIPADLVLLKTNDNSGTVFIKTDQLDGETDWKLRKSVRLTQDYDEKELTKVKGDVIVNPPEKDIYKFQGQFKLDSGEQEGLELENTLWANTTLASDWCLGVVVYTGKETRSQMNSREPSNKLGITDLELNNLSKYLVTLMLLISFFMLCLNGFTENWGVTIIRYVLLLTNIIPISLRVNLDLAKMLYCYQISNDPDIGNSQPRNRTLPEELGRVHYLLTDKTGTLTKNEMTLKVAALENANFKSDNPTSLEEMKDLIRENLEISQYPIAEQKVKGKRKRENHFAFRDFVTALALCNNVTPVQDSTTKETILQASSPDEMALVKFADLVGVKLSERTTKSITLTTIRGRDKYSILKVFPFSSATKRMGIILHHTKTDRIIFYLKGADEVIKDKIDSKNSQTKMQEDCENYAAEGLRTLVITQRIMDRQEYDYFEKLYQEATSSMSNREELISQAMNLIENKMTFLGVTGVEDLLQDDADKVIFKLNSGGIKVWMLTGDKVETAKCISISTGMKKREQNFYEVTGLSQESEIRQKLEYEPKDTVLIIDGFTLGNILGKMDKEFIRLAANCEGVVCCRVSPTQKSLIVKALQECSDCRVAAIGDGGNDVGMIQTSHVGIGVEGKEGRQASLAADFAINEFKYLTDLLLWHGRLSYLRTAKLSNFIFHRGMIISVIQIQFIVLFYYSAIPIYNGYLMFGYSTIFTSLPVFTLVLDEDFNKETIQTYPLLYKTNQMGRALNKTRFYLWLFKSIYQGSSIMLLSIILFPYDNFVNIVAITFSSLILTELLNIYSQIQKWNKWMVLAEVFSLAAYSISILWLKNYFDLKFIVTYDFFLKVLIITFVAWLPLHLTKIIKEMVWPPKHKQIQEGPYS